MTAVYLAARFSRRRELLAYKGDLEAAGFEVTSRWLNSDEFDAIDNKLMTNPEHEHLIGDFAHGDLEDIAQARILVSFTEHPDTPHKRGGRHVEFGIAYAWGKDCVVVGHQENVFHHLSGVQYYPTWPEALRALTEKVTA